MEARLAGLVAERDRRGLLRTLRVGDGLVDFSSNDYLGLSRSPHLQDELSRRVTSTAADRPVGSTGSRLLSGHSRGSEDLETFLAEVHGTEAALLFNSGFDANLGLFGCISRPGDLIIYDELIHASVHEGMRAGRARTQAFRHNDVGHLAALLTAFHGSSSPPAAASTATSRPSDGGPPCVLVAVESVYSMDGDLAPLADLAAVCRRLGASLVVDEAHSTAVMGPRGLGLTQALGLEGAVFARLHTFGKGPGCHGAAWLCSKTVRTYLINYARPLVYSTALPPHALAAIRASYDHFMRDEHGLRARLAAVIERFRTETARRLPAGRVLPSTTAIQGVIVPGNAHAVAVANALRVQGFDVRPIRSPTVPPGTERLRVCLHAHNSLVDVDRLCGALERLLDEREAKL